MSRCLVPNWKHRDKPHERLQLGIASLCCCSVDLIEVGEGVVLTGIEVGAWCRLSFLGGKGRHGGYPRQVQCERAKSILGTLGRRHTKLVSDFGLKDCIIQYSPLLHHRTYFGSPRLSKLHSSAYGDQLSRQRTDLKSVKFVPFSFQYPFIHIPIHRIFPPLHTTTIHMRTKSELRISRMSDA